MTHPNQPSWPAPPSSPYPEPSALPGGGEPAPMSAVGYGPAEYSGNQGKPPEGRVEQLSRPESASGASSAYMSHGPSSGPHPGGPGGAYPGPNPNYAGPGFAGPAGPGASYNQNSSPYPPPGGAAPHAHYPGAAPHGSYSRPGPPPGPPGAAQYSGYPPPGPMPPGPGGPMVPYQGQGQAPVPQGYPGGPQGAPYDPNQPYAVHNTLVQNHYHQHGGQLVRVAQRNRWAALLWAFFLGMFGAHRFYLGKVGSGATMLVMSTTLALFPITFVWVMIDIVSLLSKNDQQFDLEYNCRLMG